MPTGNVQFINLKNPKTNKQTISKNERITNKQKTIKPLLLVFQFESRAKCYDIQIIVYAMDG
jgi:hypothetical protein